ncbi:GNAT family N-acetyltransferase [Ruegeria arenilitoris]|uniref:GNAT family N-acetyltransferase n=1 Tax=Ruegeria arenilitoris TaxID=1173585 RepID=UPI00147BE638|nr:GNAT family N-acetyltransferase [Ruegeria arenilitoris]
MPLKAHTEIQFLRLPQIEPAEIARHMSDPRVARHLPLVTGPWDIAMARAFIDAKEACWERDGLGHWAITSGSCYVGWGGFQREGSEWDFGLVLTADAFGLGTRITRKAIAFARADERIPHVTFLLPPSRRNLSALQRIGAHYVGPVTYSGAQFLKYRLETG